MNLTYIFEKLFVEEPGQGYPRERAVPEKRNKKILDEVKKVTYQDMVTILKNLDEMDHELVKGAFGGKNFSEYFFADCKCDSMAEAVKDILSR